MGRQINCSLIRPESVGSGKASTSPASTQREGDRVLLSGFVGDHEVAVLSQREGFEFEGDLVSDCAPLNDLVGKMLQSCPSIRCLRDPTRGGFATTLNEIALMSRAGIIVEEDRIPVRESVRGDLRVARARPSLSRQRGQAHSRLPPSRG